MFLPAITWTGTFRFCFNTYIGKTINTERSVFTGRADKLGKYCDICFPGVFVGGPTTQKSGRWKEKEVFVLLSCLQ